MQATVQTSPSQSGTSSVQPAPAKPLQYLTFMLGGETFAIGILSIKEIIEFNDFTAVPLMPDCVRGVINLRGAVVPVVDLQARFGKTPTLVDRRTCIVIVEVINNGEHQDIGVMVEAVNEVLDISTSDIEPAPSFGTRISASFIEGIGKVDDRFVILLNVNNVLQISGDEDGSHHPK